MSSIIHCQEKLINSTLMKTWAIFYFAAEKSRISICCLVMCWFSPLGCLTDVHHICRYLKYLLSSTTFALSKHRRVGGRFLKKRAEKCQMKKSDPLPKKKHVKPMNLNIKIFRCLTCVAYLHFPIILAHILIKMRWASCSSKSMCIQNTLTVYNLYFE